jgi:hypothetical protein
MYSSTLPSTSTLGGGGWSTPRPGRFTPGKVTLYLLYKRLDGPQGLHVYTRNIRGYIPVSYRLPQLLYQLYKTYAHTP